MKKLIGNTPMIKIKYKYKGQEKEIFAKLEYYNLTGSIKDRMANYIITEAIKNKKLKENMPIIEATSGNTGISLSALGAYYKRKVYIFMPDWVSEERLKLMKMYGADVKLFSKEEGGFKKCINEAKKKAKETNGYLINQFENQNNLIAHYQTTSNIQYRWICIWNWNRRDIDGNIKMSKRKISKSNNMRNRTGYNGNYF